MKKIFLPAARQRLLFAEPSPRRPEFVPTNKNPIYRVVAFSCLALALAGCRQDMHDQPKMHVHRAADFHTDRLRQAPLGHFIAVITNGYGTMPDYTAELSPQDRWAVAAYIRALQLSQNTKQGDLPTGRKPEPLQQIALHSGMPASFAGRWEASPFEPRAAAAPRGTIVSDAA